MMIIITISESSIKQVVLQQFFVNSQFYEFFISLWSFCVPYILYYSYIPFWNVSGLKEEKLKLRI